MVDTATVEQVQEQNRVTVLYMQKAQESERLSSCKKRKLGVCLVLMNGTIIQASNGPPYPLAPCEVCPREKAKSGTYLNLCRATHAERRAILTAARIGQSTEGSVLYSYMGVPCKDCLLEIIASGIKEIVCLRETYYDKLSKGILEEWVKSGGIFRVWTPK